MKSSVCNVLAMALGVACVALILHRPAAADEQKVTQQQRHVIILKAGVDEADQEQQHVIVVKADGQKSSVADAVKKALHGKLDKLPADIQAKIRMIVVGSDEEAGAVAQSASQQQQQTATVVATAPGEGEGKHVALAIAVDGKEVAGDAKEKTITVTLKDGNVLVNGKPVKIPAIKAVKSGKTFQVQPMPALKADAELVKRLKNIENELKEIRKLLEEMKQEDADD